MNACILQAFISYGGGPLALPFDDLEPINARCVATDKIIILGQCVFISEGSAAFK